MRLPETTNWAAVSDDGSVAELGVGLKTDADSGVGLTTKRLADVPGRSALHPTP
jgi:hypothetical protein